MNKILIFFAEGFEEIEGLTVVDICRRAGLDIKTVSVRLGHSSIETTNIYVHLLESVDRVAAFTFESFLN